MKLNWIFSFLCAPFLGCGQKAAAPPRLLAKQPNVVKVTSVKGFDEDGEPEIHHLDDGSLQVILAFLPPSFVPDQDEQAAEGFEDFDQQLARSIGVPVIWEDCERFLIHNPAEDTAGRIKEFLENYRNANKPS